MSARIAANTFVACCPSCQVGPNPFRKRIVQLITKNTKDTTNAIASPTKMRYALDCLLRLHTMGIVTNGVKNIANHSISPILSNKRICSYVCCEMLLLILQLVRPALCKQVLQKCFQVLANY